LAITFLSSNATQISAPIITLYVPEKEKEFGMPTAKFSIISPARPIPEIVLSQKSMQEYKGMSLGEGWD
jgi:hypothetical protein